MPGPDETLRSERFFLEPILEAHAELLFDELLDPRLYEYVPGEPPASREELGRTYARWSGRRSADGTETWYNYALRTVAGATYVGTLQATFMPNRDAMVAYQVFPRFWRSGTATECLSAMLRHLATDGALRFVAHVDTRNTASQRLLSRSGFARVRRIENADFFKGSNSDEFVYERSASEAARVLG